MEYKVIKYPDGFHYVQIEKFSRNFTFHINSYSDLWILNQIKDICDFNNQEVDLFIPNLPDAQADKRFNINESSGLKLICQFINNLNFKSVTVFHPHNSEVVEALIPKVNILHNYDFISGVLNKVDNSNLCLMSTDAGGFKPLMKLVDHINWSGNTYSASKSRIYEDGKSKLIQQVDKQDFKGEDILIIDDICVRGGTFIGLAKILKERNCGKLYLAVSHITVEILPKELFTLFDCVFTTNSKNLNYMREAKDHDGMYGTKPNNLQIYKLDE